MHADHARANARAITTITSMAMRQVLTELVAEYARASGDDVTLQAAGGVDVVRRIEGGEAFDVVVLASDAIDRLTANGRLVAESHRALARSGIALAVRAGARRPDASTEPALRDAVLAARSIGYSTGPSGRHLLQLFTRWGIADAVASRLVEARPGVPVGGMIAQGIVELGFQQASELVNVPGIEIVGLMPDAIQAITTFSGAIGVQSERAQGAAAWLAFVASPAADAAKRRHALEPAPRA